MPALAKQLIDRLLYIEQEHNYPINLTDLLTAFVHFFILYGYINDKFYYNSNLIDHPSVCYDL